MKRARNGIDKPVVDVWQRELGHLSTRSFALRLAASPNLVLRLDMTRKLDKHKGCVNTISFNGDGDILVSGSDDMEVILWNWENGQAKLSFYTGHLDNVFQAKIMPYSDERSIVTSAADGQVRHAQISERGQVNTSELARHEKRVHKLAVEPGSPHIFYSCGEDGVVNHFDLRIGAATKLFTCRAIKGRRNVLPPINLNAIAIDPRNPNLFAVAGSDEYTRLYDIRKYKWDGSSSFGRPADYFCPPDLIGDDNLSITGLAFSEQSELLVSYNDEFIYLFTKEMGLGPNPAQSSPPLSDRSGPGKKIDCCQSAMDVDEKVGPQVYKGHRNSDTVKGVNFFGPKCEYVMSGSDCGRIFIWKKKGGELIRVMEADTTVVNCVESHPHTTVLASSGIENNIKIWTPMLTERAKLPESIERVRRYHPGLIRRYVFSAFDDISDEDYFYDNGSSDDDDDDDDEDEDEDDDDDDDEDDDNDDDEDVDEDINYEEDGDHDFDDGEDGGDNDDDDDDDDVDGYDDEDNDSEAEFNRDDRRPKSRNWMYHVSSPQDLMLQLFSMQRRRMSAAEEGENSGSGSGSDLLDLILSYNANSNDSSDDDGGDNSNLEDFFS